jgi:hypothetical protein
MDERLAVFQLGADGRRGRDDAHEAAA